MPAQYAQDGRRGYDHSGVDGKGLDNEMTHRAAASIRAKVADSADAVFNAGHTFDSSERTIVMYIMRFTGDEPDRVGDVIAPYAADKWLKRWTADPEREYPSSSGRLPIVYAHNWTDADQLIGWALPEDVIIDTKGVLVAAHLFPTETAEHVWNIANEQGCGASFSFDIARGGERKVARNGKTFNELTEFQTIMEAGPCLLGAEPTAGTVLVKSIDRVMLQWKSVEAQVMRHPDMIFPPSLREAGERAIARAKAAKKAQGRCSCGAMLPPMNEAVIETEYDDITMNRSDPLMWAECKRCGVITMNTDSKTLLAQDPNELAHVIREGEREKADRRTYEMAKATLAREAEEREYTSWTPAKMREFEQKAMESTDPTVVAAGIQAEAKAWLDSLDGVKASDRAEELFDLSDKQHTTIAVGIVFGAQDERDGTPLSTWHYRGGVVGADLSASERAHVVQRVRDAARRFGISLTSGTTKTAPSRTDVDALLASIEKTLKESR